MWNDQKDFKLDSCDRNLINTGGSTTVGDYLCGQVRRWLRNSASFKSGGIRNRVVMNFIIIGILDGLILKKIFCPYGQDQVFKILSSYEYDALVDYIIYIKD